MTEVVQAIIDWITGERQKVNAVRMLELAEIFHAKGMHLWCGAAVELADMAAGV